MKQIKARFDEIYNEAFTDRIDGLSDEVNQMLREVSHWSYVQGRKDGVDELIQDVKILEKRIEELEFRLEESIRENREMSRYVMRLGLITNRIVDQLPEVK